jgi:hypothetical protein
VQTLQSDSALEPWKVLVVLEGQRMQKRLVMFR